ncbi:hypothetical protein GO755_38180 [Spirosoma sp. HMF4905]|uniref:Uncharacterized protein n=1 Tax=Spirosoma arboris TaxID=2682092 RepID=A0A7K1SQ15_9BACT|nr:hypothetical protein [Spirosoma arboris]MVM35905.1 hypothetical protein [Spirosoma arboris]
MSRISTTALAFALTTFVLAASLALLAASWFLFTHLQMPIITINPF